MSKSIGIRSAVSDKAHKFVEEHKDNPYLAVMEMAWWMESLMIDRSVEILWQYGFFEKCQTTKNDLRRSLTW